MRRDALRRALRWLTTAFVVFVVALTAVIFLGVFVLALLFPHGLGLD